MYNYRFYILIIEFIYIYFFKNKKIKNLKKFIIKTILFYFINLFKNNLYIIKKL